MSGKYALADETQKFLEKTAWILLKCDLRYSTQVNEAFNRAKIKYGNKDVGWRYTWRARMCCAVLDRNRKDWKMELFEEMGLSLGPKATDLINGDERKRLNLVDERAKAGGSRKTKKPLRQSQNMDEIAYRPNPYARSA
jgi:hypothetical protein